MTIVKIWLITFVLDILYSAWLGNYYNHHQEELLRWAMEDRYRPKKMIIHKILRTWNCIGLPYAYIYIVFTSL